MSTLFEKTFHRAHEYFPEGGTLLEFGVFVGKTFEYQAMCMDRGYKNDSLIGFDSFQGLPAETEGVWYPTRHRIGNYSSSRYEVEKRISGMSSRDKCKLVEGFYCDTLTEELQNTISNVIFVNIDVDLHSSTLEVLDFIKPLVQKGTLIYWDDWKNPTDVNNESWGEHRAWKEWEEVNTTSWLTIEVNKLNQRTMVAT